MVVMVRRVGTVYCFVMILNSLLSAVLLDELLTLLVNVHETLLTLEALLVNAPQYRFAFVARRQLVKCLKVKAVLLSHVRRRIENGAQQTVVGLFKDQRILLLVMKRVELVQ